MRQGDYPALSRRHGCGAGSAATGDCLSINAVPPSAPARAARHVFGILGGPPASTVGFVAHGRLTPALARLVPAEGQVVAQGAHGVVHGGRDAAQVAAFGREHAHVVFQLGQVPAVVAAVGRKMAYRPGVSGKIFAKLGENGVNIRMITQGPEELNIIVGVEEKDFAQAIRVLYDSFVKEHI